MKPTKKQTDKATIAAYKKWARHAEEYQDYATNEDWWDKTSVLGCPLCGIFNSCDIQGCPLNDSGDAIGCCDEWEEADRYAYTDELTKKMIEAVRDRIKRECIKRGLSDNID